MKPVSGIRIIGIKTSSARTAPCTISDALSVREFSITPNSERKVNTSAAG
jgi:hypothetical protein